jgi:hypothetical protein
MTCLNAGAGAQHGYTFRSLPQQSPVVPDSLLGMRALEQQAGAQKYAALVRRLSGSPCRVHANTLIPWQR